ncbi:MAG: hypothetical protein M3357_05925 [Actinomycetota bacterium]|nr:hypothetical protein [Actinomycetota bacterium]
MITDEPVRGGFPDPTFFNLSGMERTRAFLREEVPRTPLHHLIGMRPTQAGPGAASATLPATAWHQHGDSTLDLKLATATILEFATVTGIPSGTDVRLVAMSMTHLRPCTLEHAPVVLRSRVLHSGPNFTLAEALVEDGLGRSVGHATGHLLVRPVEPPPPDRPYEWRPESRPTYPTPDPYLRPLPPGVGTVPLERVSELSGVACMRATMDGDLPEQPVFALTGIRNISVDEGSAVLVMPASEWLCRYTRRISAGAVACLVHQGLCESAFTLSPGGHRVGIVDQNISFFGSAVPDGRELVCRSKVVHDADGLIHSVAEVSDGAGNRLALGRQTSLLIESGHRRRETAVERVLATVLFTDIVGSTEHAERLGDAKWRELLDEHHALVRRQVRAFKGREVKMTGDGFLIAFDSPARAVQCARAIRDGLSRLGIEIRAGLHSGECEVVGSDVAGIAVHVASRIQAAAGPGEVLVSSTVRDVVAGSGLRFADRGRHPLKGLEGDWHLLAVED